MKTIRLDGVVGWDITASGLAAEIDGDEDVKLILNSGGGDITEGFAIYNMLNDHAGRVEVHIDFAASMMSVIAMAGDSISMKANSSIMMIHRPWGGIAGNSEHLRSHADTLDKMESMLLSIYSEKSTLSSDEISKMLSDETYLNAKEALDIGLIDSIVGGKSDLAAIAVSGIMAKDKVEFDSMKFAAKLNSVKSEKPSTKDAFLESSTLADVERVMRNEFNVSRSEATAIVAAVKKVAHGDREEKEEVLNVFKNYKFKF